MAWPAQTELWSTVETIDGATVTHNQIDEIIEYIANVITTRMGQGKHVWSSAVAGNDAGEGKHIVGEVGILKADTAANIALLSPQTGALVYDTDSKQMKRYSGTAWVPMLSGGPAVVVNNSGGSDQTLTAATWCEVQLDTEVLDYGACFAGDTWTPTVAGLYLITGAIVVTSCAAAEYCGLRLYNATDASTRTLQYNHCTYAGNVHLAGSTLVYSDGTAAFQLQAYCTGARVLTKAFSKIEGICVMHLS